ncbi:MAG: hypothetical protein KIT89_13430 [Microcella sp.]|uniref:hypothetical protein n=1 Tax=Microcella sp. TaxID=1913979 RepID=UPI0024CCE9B1|nr:hypothetical protein [Microcella sp.]UYN83650.1 MAG: hypothetical protein KIT89_13430 [Microcella sp.]
MSLHDAIAVAAEALAWLTVPLGIVMLGISLARRSWSRQYRSVKGVVSGVHRGDATVRWFSDGGEVHEAVVDFEAPPPAEGDARTIWVHPSRPDEARTDDPAHDGRVLLTLGAVLTSVGVLGLVLSFVLPLL